MQTILAILSIEYTYGRTLLAGMLDELHGCTGWRVRLARNAADLRAILAQKQPFAAAVGMIWDRRQVRSLRRRCGVTVSFAHLADAVADRHLVLDDAAIGRLAAEEFSQLGLERTAVYQPENHFHFVERSRGMLEAAPASTRIGSSGSLLRWARRQSHPAGVLAVNDVHGLAAAEALSTAGMRIPESLSVLGVDDDEVFVHLGPRLLSSIRVPFHEMGREAIRAVMGGPGDSMDPVRRLAPLGVVHRETTSNTAALPALMRAFLNQLQRARPLPHSVGAACAAWRLPRRSLELACRERGCTPHGLLRQERRRRARFLAASGLPDARVSEELGFEQTRSLHRLLARPG
jgi:hypothetical protein